MRLTIVQTARVMTLRGYKTSLAQALKLEKRALRKLHAHPLWHEIMELIGQGDTPSRPRLLHGEDHGGSKLS